MRDSRTGEIPLSLWFGNFYEPAYSDRGFVDRAVREIRELGFNSVLLDSKSWEDFRERFAGGEASPYVATQEYLMARIAEAGMGHRFLALYLNGDNLYPHIRFSPPVYGESVTAPDGSDGKWYKYWSPAAKESMVRHVEGLVSLYSQGATLVETMGEERLPLCSMWDPVVAPSFDEDGVRRYRSWLARTYEGDVIAVGRAYGKEFASFDEIKPEDYWYSLKYGENRLTRADLDSRAPRFRVAADNMKWRLFELREYFRDMERRLHEICVPATPSPESAAVSPGACLRLEPNLTQWNFFLNIDGSLLPGVSFNDLWDTANRGIDPWALRDCVDDCSFTLVPVTPAGDPEAWVLSCQASMIRSLNERPGPGRGPREFTVGLFLGRFLFNDVLRFVPPAELIGAAAASGASAIAAYGYGGMDDGGILHRMDDAFKDSIKAGLAWAKRVMPLRGARLPSPIALLFPSAMALLEPLSVEGAQERRLDLLGWYRSSSEAGYGVDIIDPGQIEEGALSSYAILVLPANDCYDCDPRPEAERAMREWVEAGGLLVHGPADRLAKAAFGIEGRSIERDCADYLGLGGAGGPTREGMLAQGDAFEAWDSGEALATWRTTGESCIAHRVFGSGSVYSFGFRYGYSYVSRIAPHVPASQGNRELYPVTHMRRDPWREVLASRLGGGEGRASGRAAPKPGRDIEIAAFERGWVVVNHSSEPYSLAGLPGERHHQYETGELLMPHAAVFIEKTGGVPGH
jgi:hypothetical protein